MQELATAMTFTQSLWKDVEGIFARIKTHLFLIGLTDGSLPEPSFRFYAIQDALYLKDFARGLVILGAKAPRDEWLVLFSSQARTVLEVERTLHESFFHDWNLTEAEVYDTPMAPNNLLYTSYLLRIAHDRPFHEGVGAFLPCYWIYWEVGKELMGRGSPVRDYQKWIDTYAAEDFGAVVRRVLEVVDEVADQFTEEQRRVIQRHFVTSARLEYLFWDMGYQRQMWPI